MFIGKTKLKTVVGVLFLFGWQGVAANLNNCGGVFYKGVKPIIQNQSLNVNKYEICYQDFAVAYSGVSKGGLWTAEVMTPNSLAKAAQIDRQDNFREDTRVSAAHNATLNDYRGSGYDRGHLGPSAQRTSRQAQNDSFYLTNIFPQNSKLNQGSWNNIEQATRSYVKNTQQTMYMVTGTLFLTPNLKRIGNNVLVPSHVYKAIYLPNMNIAGAYVAVNDGSNRIDTVSIYELEKYSGVQFFDGLRSQKIYNTRFNLPMNPSQASNKSVKGQAKASSSIFAMAPNNLSKYSGQYRGNGGVAVESSKGVSSDLGRSAIGVIRGN